MTMEYLLLVKLYHYILSLLGLYTSPKKQESSVVSVNYHFTRKCNYECGFCFHTELTGSHLPLVDAKRGVDLLIAAGMRKLNFAGGEPFLYPKFVGELAKYAKEHGLESVSIVSNASKLNRRWFEKYGQYIDVLAVSCDSTDDETNRKIGRRERTKPNERPPHVANIRSAAELCADFDIKFKINTVVNAYNYQEDMNDLISELCPTRWKVFQVLKVDGENSGEKSLRNVNPFLISDEQFKEFLLRHKEQECLVPEPNDVMQTSYLLLDEEMRFLDCSTGGKRPTESILKIGVELAVATAGFDYNKFVQRDGIYDWTRATPAPCKPCADIPDW